jgi:hypothetical protein
MILFVYNLPLQLCWANMKTWIYTRLGFQTLAYWMEDRGRRSSTGKVKNVPLHVFQTGSGALSACNAISTLGSKGAEPWSWPLTSNYSPAQENVDLYSHSPYTFMA